jgi:5-dehydro-2-deoxygluconokinase
MLTRVGDEHNGRFVRERLAAEGVDVSHVSTDPQRLTALVFLGIRDRDTFPLVFYRDRCADMALGIDDMDDALHLPRRAPCSCPGAATCSQPGTFRRLQRRSIGAARRTAVVLDNDYTVPLLWGLNGHPGSASSATCRPPRRRAGSGGGPHCDHRGRHARRDPHRGRLDRHAAAIRRPARAHSVRRWSPSAASMGCVVLDGAIPPRLDDASTAPASRSKSSTCSAPAMPSWRPSARLVAQRIRSRAVAAYANAWRRAGRVAPRLRAGVPSEVELQHFLAHGSPTRRCAKTPRSEHLHRVTTRTRRHASSRCWPFDHRCAVEELARGPRATAHRPFKQLCQGRGGRGRDPAPAYRRRPLRRSVLPR